MLYSIILPLPVNKLRLLEARSLSENHTVIGQTGFQLGLLHHAWWEEREEKKWDLTITKKLQKDILELWGDSWNAHLILFCFQGQNKTKEHVNFFLGNFILKWALMICPCIMWRELVGSPSCWRGGFVFLFFVDSYFIL